MKSLRSIICVAVLVINAMVILEGRETLPKDVPSFSNVAYREDISLRQRTVFGLAMVAAKWEVEDYYVFKIARLREKRDIWPVSTIFSEGKWHK